MQFLQSKQDKMIKLYPQVSSVVLSESNDTIDSVIEEHQKKYIDKVYILQFMKSLWRMIRYSKKLTKSVSHGLVNELSAKATKAAAKKATAKAPTKAAAKKATAKAPTKAPTKQSTQKRQLEWKWMSRKKQKNSTKKRIIDADAEALRYAEKTANPPTKKKGGKGTRKKRRTKKKRVRRCNKTQRHRKPKKK
jgi:hypothetical protein